MITGRTGSGKSMEAIAQLSQRSFGERPWTVLDFKGDDLVSQLPITAPWTIHDAPPTEPGLYVVKFDLSHTGKGGAVDTYLRRVYAQGNHGTFLDEALWLGHHNTGLKMLLTQGRSRSCPLIIVTQRPVNIDVYAWSESEYIQCFHLQRPDDQDTMTRAFPRASIDFDRFPEYGPHHSLYYDVRRGTVELCAPCPDFPDLYDRILAQLPVYEHEHIPGLPRRVRV